MAGIFTTTSFTVKNPLNFYSFFAPNDFDDDGILDDIDLDDDNDGIPDEIEDGACTVVTIFTEDFGTQLTVPTTLSTTSPYTNYTFFEATVGTPAPAWTGGLNDGIYPIFNDIKYTADWAPTT